MITQAINLNLIPGQVLPRVNVSQYDSGTRTLQMTLFNGEQIFNVPSGASGFIQGTKPDRTGFQYAATVTAGSNIVTIDITQQMTAVKGEVVCELVLANDDDRIATVNFILYVEAAALADDTVISETDLPLIEEAAELAERIDGIVQQVDEDAQTASDAADKAEAYGTHPPYIGANGNWFVYNVTTQQYEDSGVKAQGPLSGLTDVALSTLTDAQSLIYDATSQKWVNGSVAYSSLSGKPTLGTAAAKDVPASGNASSAEVVLGSDTRLTDARTPVSHTHTKSEITDFPTLGTAAAKNSTNAVTANSTDLVESGAVYTADKGIYEVMGQNGAKNVFPLLFSDIKAWNTGGTWNNNVYTYRGVTYTCTVKNGYITKIDLTGTCESNASIFDLYGTNISGYWLTNKYKGMCLSGGKSADISLQARGSDNDSGSGRVDYNDTGNGVIIGDKPNLRVLILISVGTSTGVSIEPMIRLASDTDDTYQSYAKTNQQLTADTNGLWDNMMENGAVNLAINNMTNQSALGIDFTVGENGAITASGTATGNIRIDIGTVWLKKGITYRITDTSDLSESDQNQQLIVRTSGGTWIMASSNTGDTPNKHTPSNDFRAVVTIAITSGQTVSKTFYPMVSIVSYTGPYVPYAMTNRELTEDVTSQEIAITPNSDYVSSSSVNVYKVGKLRFLEGYFFTRDVPQHTVLFTVDAKPLSNNTYLMFAKGDGTFYLGKVDSNKQIQLDSSTSMSAGAYAIVGSYLVE